MSDNLPKSNNNEEIDILAFFDYFGKKVNSVFKGIGSLLKRVFSIFIYALRALVDNAKLIAIVLILAAIAGFALEKIRPTVYTSQMIVKPYFESKFQLIQNINYYNALIEAKDYKQLTRIFTGINENDAEQLVEFEITPGPETENDKVKQYVNFLKGLDSVRKQEVDYQNFIDNRSVYSGSIFQISVQSLKKDIFRSLEEGLNSTFTNEYSIKKMEQRDSIMVINKQRILANLETVDSLKRVHTRVFLKGAENQDVGSFTTKDGLAFIQEKTKTKEVDLLNQEMRLRQELSALESKKVEEDVFFDTLSSFQEVGAVYTSIWKRFSIIFPILAFIGLCTAYLTNIIIKYVRNYES